MMKSAEQRAAEKTSAAIDLVERVSRDDPVHTQYVPLMFAIEMINKQKIDWENANIMVLYDFSLLFAVLEKVMMAGGNVRNITFFCSYDKKKKAAESLGVNVEYISYEELLDIERHELIIRLKGKNNMEFDGVFENPPYKLGNDGKGPGTKVSGTKGSPVWQRFIGAGLNILKPNGFLITITPSGWMNGARPRAKMPASSYIDDHGNRIKESPSTPILKLLQNRNLVYLDTTQCDRHNNVFSNVENKKAKATTRAAWFVVQNSPYNGSTELCYNYGGRKGTKSIDVRKFKSFPAYVNDLNLGIFGKILNMEPKFELLNESKLTERTENGKYEYYQSGANSRQRGICFNRYEFPSKLQTTKKVVIARETGDCYEYFYDEGKYGVCADAHIFQIDTSPLVTEETVNSYFGSKLIRYYSRIAPYSGRCNDTAVKAIPKIDLTRVWTDNELYVLFDLVQEEIDLIERTEL